jgi:hypothetical protein
VFPSLGAADEPSRILVAHHVVTHCMFSPGSLGRATPVEKSSYHNSYAHWLPYILRNIGFQLWRHSYVVDNLKEEQSQFVQDYAKDIKELTFIEGTLNGIVTVLYSERSSRESD